jgi:hypothetical protein
MLIKYFFWPLFDAGLVRFPALAERLLERFETDEIFRFDLLGPAAGRRMHFLGILAPDERTIDSAVLVLGASFFLFRIRYALCARNCSLVDI